MLFPLLAQKVPDASKLHSPSEVPSKHLLALLGTVETNIKLRCSQKPFQMAAVKSAVLALEEASVTHFAAMEAVPLAHLRAHWTREEVKKALEKKIVDDGDNDNHDIGWLCARCFSTPTSSATPGCTPCLRSPWSAARMWPTRLLSDT